MQENTLVATGCALHGAAALGMEEVFSVTGQLVPLLPVNTLDCLPHTVVLRFRNADGGWRNVEVLQMWDTPKTEPYWWINNPTDDPQMLVSLGMVCGPFVCNTLHQPLSISVRLGPR
jgi:hypothetical protein